MVERHVAAIGDDPVDKFDLTWLKSQCAVAPVKRTQIIVRELRNLLVENVVFVDCYDAEPPARRPKILRIRVNTDRVLRQLTSSDRKSGTNVP